jgi:hypothetical protein
MFHKTWCMTDVWFVVLLTQPWLSQLELTQTTSLVTLENLRRALESQEEPIKPAVPLRNSSKGMSAHPNHLLGARTLTFRLINLLKSWLTRHPDTRLETKQNFYWKETRHPGRSLSREVSTRKPSLKTMNYSALIRRLSPFSQYFVEKLLNSLEWKC